MITIPLSQNKYMLVDEKDYPLIKRFKWYAIRRAHIFYAETTIQANNHRQRILAHRLLLGLRPGDRREADHINHNGLDNRQQNLRVADRQKNCRNMRPYKNTTSKYKGVAWDKYRKKWRAYSKIDGQQKYLGRFDREIDAAVAYNNFASRYFGEYATLNIVVDPLRYLEER